MLGESDGKAWDSARRQAGIASNALESALSRSMLEPRLVSGGHVNAALTIDAALRRIMGRLTVLRASWAGGQAADLPYAITPDAIRQWRQWCADCAGRVLNPETADAMEIALPPRPPLAAPDDEPVADSLRRIARQIELIAGAMPKLRH